MPNQSSNQKPDDNAKGQNQNVEPQSQNNASASGVDGGAGDDGGSNSGAGDGGSQNGDGKTFTQDEVTKMMTKEKQQGRNSAYNKLGIDPNNSDLIAKVAEFVKSQQPSGDAAVEEANKKVKEAEARAKAAETKAELLEAGIVTNYVDDALVLVNARLDEETDINDAISELKKKFPVWFTTTNQGSKQFRGTGTNPAANQSSQSGNAGNDDKGSLGHRLAASRKTAKPKFSYFGNKQ